MTDEVPSFFLCIALMLKDAEHDRVEHQHKDFHGAPSQAFNQWGSTSIRKPPTFFGDVRRHVQQLNLFALEGRQIRAATLDLHTPDIVAAECDHIEQPETRPRLRAEIAALLKNPHRPPFGATPFLLRVHGADSSRASAAVRRVSVSAMNRRSWAAVRSRTRALGSTQSRSRLRRDMPIRSASSSYVQFRSTRSRFKATKNSFMGGASAGTTVRPAQSHYSDGAGTVKP